MACGGNGGALISNGAGTKLTIKIHRVFRNPDKKPGGDQDMKRKPGRLPEKIIRVPPGGSYLIKPRYLDASQDGPLGRPEFDFSIPGEGILTWSRDKFEGNNEYVCQIGPDGLEIKAEDGKSRSCCCSCLPWIFNLRRKKPGPPPLSTCVAISSGDPNPEADNDDGLELVAAAVKVEGGI